jgi:hypothetical protein
MSDDKVKVWALRIQEEGGKVAKDILDKLVALDKTGFANLTPVQRRDVHERIARAVTGAMYRLGTFVVAGAQDTIPCKLESAAVKGPGEVKLTLIPAESANLHTIVDNAGKDVVIACVNALAYSQARESLVSAVTREQTDWVQREEETDTRTIADMQEQEAGNSAEPESEEQTDGDDTSDGTSGEGEGGGEGEGDGEAGGARAENLGEGGGDDGAGDSGPDAAAEQDRGGLQAATG